MERAEVDVWLLAQPHAPVPLSWLDDIERARAAALPPGQAASFVTARRLLRAVLAERLGLVPAGVPLVARCARCGGPHGQVRVETPAWPGAARRAAEPPPCHVSISRSGPLIAVATAELPVGVDVESVAAVAAAPLADVALSVEERGRRQGPRAEDGRRSAPPTTGRRAPATDRPGNLARTWAGKEAVLKALGTGLDLDPSSFTLTLPVTTVRTPGGARTVAVADLLPSSEAKGADPEETATGVLMTYPRPALTGSAGAVAVVGAPGLMVRVHDGEAALVRAGRRGTRRQ